MEIVASLSLGYLLGTISPAALLGKLKNVNLKENGTKNLGASNALILLGRSAGIIVMVVDIFKALLASCIARWLFPALKVAGMLAGLGAVLGHIFPFYLKFQGGKGLAAFGGMVGAYSPWLLVFYLTGGVALMLLANRSVFLPMFAAITFPLIVAVQTRDPWMVLIAVIAGAVIAIKHWSNIGKVKRGKEAPVRDIFRKKIFKKD